MQAPPAPIATPTMAPRRGGDHASPPATAPATTRTSSITIVAVRKRSSFTDSSPPRGPVLVPGPAPGSGRPPPTDQLGGIEPRLCVVEPSGDAGLRVVAGELDASLPGREGPHGDERVA